MAFIRFLILVALIVIGQFVVWYLQEDHIGQPFLYWTLTFALGYKLLHLLYEWYYYASMESPVRPEKKKEWKVDVLTTYVPGEPKDMLIHTLQAMAGIRYPHTTYLCDEGDDPHLKLICEELGVVHIYRGKVKTGAKAGNINYALRNYADGEITVILDPDHIPVPELLDRALPFFEDPKVAFVQSIQGYYNQEESFIAMGAAEQTYMFYGPMMLGMQRRGTVQAIGANCVFRRAALDSIGGHATGLCEDMHTSMQIHARGWTSVYLPELLTRGMTPASIGAYYQQQLKWCRGSFELLFEVYSRLFSNFTWTQRIHYFLVPLYFLYGIIGLIDLGVPIFSLLTYQVPLLIDFQDFVIRILPVLAMIFLVRHYVQRFVLDQHEAGFHFTGGILRVSTWWIYLMGFLFALFRVNVPYIPTLKSNERANEWIISLPNIIVIFFSIFAVIYGLQRDFTPFTWIMAGFAGVNVILLGYIVIISQQKMLAEVYQKFIAGAWSLHRLYWFKFRHRFIYKLLRNSFVVLVLGVSIVSLSSIHFLGLTGKERHLSDFYPNGEKDLGIWLSRHDADTPGDLLHRSVAVFTIREEQPDRQQKLKVIMDDALIKELTPLIKLVISIDTSKIGQDGVVATERLISQFEALAADFRDFQRPLILQPCWETTQYDPPFSAPQAWYQALKEGISAAGASNVLVAWEQLENEKYPIPQHTDLIITHASGPAADLSVIRKSKGYRQQPILLVRDCKSDCNAFYQPEHRTGDSSVPLLGWVSESDYEQTDSETDTLFEEKRSLSNSLNEEKDLGQPILTQIRPKREPASAIVPVMGHKNQFEWRVDDAPFYIKGIVYNPQHNWRDGKWPLTRRRLQKDFTAIKAAGGNTISREKPTVYDKNILQVASEMDLKVIYGFSFDPELDYLQDTQEVNRLRLKVLSQVENFKDAPALLAWTIGSGTWESLSAYFHEPYLTEVRLAYAKMIGGLARDIKQCDPQHPVLTGLIGNRDFRSALDDLEEAMAYVDAVAVNAYYPEQLEQLQTTLQNWGVEAPYLINEFGPKVNWQTPVFGYDDHDRILEPTCYEKGRLYARLWTAIEKDRGRNLGGLAYCWRDRFEGTATFSGITDLQGRLKPAYFSLKESWTGEAQSFPLADLKLKFGTIFANKSINLVYSAMTANNLDETLTYDWYIYREEYMERIHRLRIRPRESVNLQYLQYRLINEYNEHIERSLYQIGNRSTIRYYRENAEPLQRIYLSISDDRNNVVTASFPIYPSSGHE